MTNAPTISGIRRKTMFAASGWLLSVVVILPLAGTGSVRAGETADLTVTARITTCRPKITVTDYAVTVKPSDGRGEGAETSGATYFPAAVALIDNTECDSDVDVTGETDGQAANPGLHLNKIGASVSINAKEGIAGGWTTTEGASTATLTVPAGGTQALFAGINPWAANTDYITGSDEGAITLTLSPH